MRYFLGLWAFSTALAAAEPLVPAENFLVDGQLAQQDNKPIAILLLHEGVRSAQQLKELALLPNLLSGAFDGKVLFREIAVNQPGNLIDFYGEPLPKAEFRSLFNVTSLPAMVFVDAQGNPLTEPLFSGAYDFYGYYLKQKLNQAMAALNNPTRFE